MNAEKSSSKSVIADAALLLVAAIWGGGFVAGKMALSDLSPIAILMYRFCGSAVIFGILFWKRIKKARRQEWKYGLLIGTVQFFGLLVQLIGLQYTTSAKQSFLAAAYVIFTPLTAWAILKHRPVRKDGIAAVTALLGIALISLNSSLQIQLGDPVTLLFALIFSIQIVLVGKYAVSLDILALTFYQFTCSGILSLLSVCVTRTPVICTAKPAISGICYLVFINTALAIGLQNIAQKYTKSSHTALLLSLESVFGFLFSVLIYKDIITVRMMAGCGLVFLAVLISNMSGQKAKTTQTAVKCG